MIRSKLKDQNDSSKEVNQLVRRCFSRFMEPVIDLSTYLEQNQFIIGFAVLAKLRLGLNHIFEKKDEESHSRRIQELEDLDFIYEPLVHDYINIYHRSGKRVLDLYYKFQKSILEQYQASAYPQEFRKECRFLSYTHKLFLKGVLKRIVTLTDFEEKIFNYQKILELEEGKSSEFSLAQFGLELEDKEQKEVYNSLIKESQNWLNSNLSSVSEKAEIVRVDFEQQTEPVSQASRLQQTEAKTLWNQIQQTEKFRREEAAQQTDQSVKVSSSQQTKTKTFRSRVQQTDRSKGIEAAQQTDRSKGIETAQQTDLVARESRIQQTEAKAVQNRTQQTVRFKRIGVAQQTEVAPRKHVSIHVDTIEKPKKPKKVIKRDFCVGVDKIEKPVKVTKVDQIHQTLAKKTEAKASTAEVIPKLSTKKTKGIEIIPRQKLKTNTGVLAVPTLSFKHISPIEIITKKSLKLQRSRGIQANPLFNMEYQTLKLQSQRSKKSIAAAQYSVRMSEKRHSDSMSTEKISKKKSRASKHTVSKKALSRSLAQSQQFSRLSKLKSLHKSINSSKRIKLPNTKPKATNYSRYSKSRTSRQRDSISRHSARYVGSKSSRFTHSSKESGVTTESSGASSSRSYSYESEGRGGNGFYSHFGNGQTGLHCLDY